MSSKPNSRPDSPPNGGELLQVVGLALLVCSLSGCAWSRSLFDRNPYAENAACHLPVGTDGQEIVHRINERAERHSSWRAANAQVHYKGPEGSHTLTAHLAVEAPLNFSLTAGTSLMGPEVELGSNEERFWFWARRAPKKCIMTARHEDLEYAQQQFPIPFQPEWLMEALGVIPMDPKDVQIEMAEPDPKTKKSRVWLISNRTSPQGEPVRKVTLVDACHGLPLKHELIDANNKRIATASLYKWHAGPDGEPVPGSIHLSWPEAKLELTLDLGTVEMNPSMPATAWELPSYKNTPVFDLGHAGRNMARRKRAVEGVHVPQSEVTETESATTDPGEAEAAGAEAGGIETTGGEDSASAGTGAEVLWSESPAADDQSPQAGDNGTETVTAVGTEPNAGVEPPPSDESVIDEASAEESPRRETALPEEE